MERKHFGTSLVYEAGKYTLLTVVPKAAVSILGIRAPAYLAWRRAGEYYEIYDAGGAGEDARRLQKVPTHVLTLTQPVAAQMRVGDGSLLQWYAAADGGKIMVHARPGKSPAGPTSRKTAKCKMLARPLGTTRIRQYTYEKIPRMTKTAMPRACVTILRLDDPAYIRWERRGRYYEIVPSTKSDPESRRVNSITRTKNHEKSSFQLLLPPGPAARLCRGASPSVKWSIAYDGRWSVLVEPA